MSAKQQLLDRVRGLSEAQAAAALRLLDTRPPLDEHDRDEWGDLDQFSARASAATLRRLDEREAAAGFSWEDHRRP